MESRLSMDWDFEKNSPYIQVTEKKSLDLRDRVFSSFREKLGHTSSWCKISFDENPTLDGQTNYIIEPITPEQMRDEAQEIMRRHVNGK